MTQIIWKSSTKLGCGYAACNGSPYWSCNFDPGGNMVGAHTQNIDAPISPAPSCAQSGAGSTGATAGGTVTTTSTTTTTTRICTTTTAAPASSGGGGTCTQLSVPSPKLPNLSRCLFGLQCSSNFCCPRLRICLVSATTPTPGCPSLIPDAMKCGWGAAQSMKCNTYENSMPEAEFNNAHADCGCGADFISAYNAGTWTGPLTGGESNFCNFQWGPTSSLSGCGDSGSSSGATTTTAAPTTTGAPSGGGSSSGSSSGAVGGGQTSCAVGDSVSAVWCPYDASDATKGRLKDGTIASMNATHVTVTWGDAGTTCRSMPRYMVCWG